MNKPLFPYRPVPSLTPAFAGVTDGISAPNDDSPRRTDGGWLLTTGGDDPNRTVRAGRRRRSEPPGPEGRQRAEAPHRRTVDDGGGGGAPSGGGGGGLPIPGGSKGAIGGIGGLLLLCIVIAFALLGGNLGGNDTSAPEPPPVSDNAELPAALGPTAAPEPTARAQAAQPRATAAASGPAATVPGATAPGAATTGQSWLVMLYEDADDKILEQDIYVDLNETEKVGSSDRVQMVAQIDRYSGGFRGDGNWTGTRRYYIHQDPNLDRVSSQLVQDMGELNMSEGQTLADFVTWAVQNYHADKYVLILSDHGMGWPGGFSDPDPGSQRQRIDRKIPLEQALGDELYLNEMDDALAAARQQTGIDKFELIGLDACLMGHLEVMAALEPHARYAVVSQETEPALGWAYTSFLGALSQNPDMDGASLAQTIVKSYIQDDQRIVDEDARTEWVGRGSPMGSAFGGLGMPSAQDLREELSRSITLTAVDLSATAQVMSSFNDLAYRLQQVDQRGVAKARRYAQSFTSIFGSQVPPSYIDIGHFVGLLKQMSRDPGVTQAGDAVRAALEQAVIAEKHGSDKAGATGLSIYFPNSDLYGNAAAGAPSYTAVAQRFAQNSLWDEFLAFHYAGRTFDQETGGSAVPPSGVGRTRAPGAGNITLSSIQASSQTAAPGQPVLLSTNVSGDNIGYIYFFTGYHDRASNSIYVADRDYLEAPTTREADGVYYPDWGEGDFKLEFEWEPLAYAITDGQESVSAALNPEIYGATYQDTVYTLDGNYTYRDGETRPARLYFRDNLLRQVFGFAGDGQTGAPREITPAAGDTFTVTDTWLESDGRGGTQMATEQGGTLTFRDQPFKWQELDAAAGDYVVGFIVTDLDGNSQEVYTQVTVQ
jgi:hypothetical protein